MKIADFTKPELDYFRENCNFVGVEKEVFEFGHISCPSPVCEVILRNCFYPADKRNYEQGKEYILVHQKRYTYSRNCHACIEDDAFFFIEFVNA